MAAPTRRQGDQGWHLLGMPCRDWLRVLAAPCDRPAKRGPETQRQPAARGAWKVSPSAELGKHTRRLT